MADYIILFGERKTKEFALFLSKALQRTGLQVVDEDEFLRVIAPMELLLRQAEAMELQKKTVDKDPLDYKEFEMDSNDQFQDFGKENFFTLSERALLIAHIMDSIPCGKEFSEFAVRQTYPQQPILNASIGNHLVEFAFPTHEQEKKRVLWMKIFKSWTSIPIHQMQEYFGPQVSFYYAWMDYYLKWLVPPAIVGILFWLYRPEGVTVDNSPYLPFFSLFIIFWSILFMEFWKRKTAELSLLWNTYDVTRKERVRPEFYGEPRKSRISGEIERYYPDWKRYLKYLVSAIVTGFMLCIALAVMFCSLNLQGYMESDEKFYIKGLAQYSEAGAIFDANSDIMFIIPTILHSVVILVLNTFYRRIATALTEWENHRTESEFESTLVIKRFLFEAFDSYIALFYIAFYKLDLLFLRKELISLYTADEIRRLATETIIPYLLEKKRSHDKKKAIGKAKKQDTTLDNLIEETQMDDMELFDDYLEMVIQFGYVTLFASSFSLAAVLSIVSNLIEVRSDCFKLFFLQKRARPVRAASIGVWYHVLEVLSMLSILTNCLLFAFTSKQMLQWFPWLFGLEGNEQILLAGQGRYVVGIVFGIEHVVILVAIFVKLIIPDSPAWVDEEIKRREYKKFAVIAHRRDLLLNKHKTKTKTNTMD